MSLLLLLIKTEISVANIFKSATYFYKNSSSILNLFVAILKHLMVGDLYDAIAAELTYQIDVSDKGIAIKVYGFNEKLSVSIHYS